MHLEYEFTITMSGGINWFGDQPGPFGTRQIASGFTGSFDGERLRGRVVEASDWFLAPGGEWGWLDARVLLETHDGALILMAYEGVLEYSPALLAVAQSGSAEIGTDYDDHYYRIAPKLEAGDRRYSWVNHTLFVGRGHVLPGAGTFEYEVYAVT
jgi:Protein of unknown function (DUF3237)